MAETRIGDVQAERQYIEAVIHAPGYGPELVEMVGAEDFTDPHLRLILRTARGLVGRGKEASRFTIRRALEQEGHWKPEDVELFEPPANLTEDALMERACVAVDSICAFAEGDQGPALVRADLAAARRDISTVDISPEPPRNAPKGSADISRVDISTRGAASISPRPGGAPPQDVRSVDISAGGAGGEQSSGSDAAREFAEIVAKGLGAGAGALDAWPEPTWENNDLVLDSFETVVRPEFKAEWLWPGWLARGVLTVIASSPGEGKSAVALEVIRRVVGGAPTWPDGCLCSTAAPGCGAASYVAQPPPAESCGLGGQENAGTGEGACDTSATAGKAVTGGGSCATPTERATPGGGCATQATQAPQAAQETVILVDTEASEAIWRMRVGAWGIDPSRLLVFESKNGELGMVPLQLEREEDIWALASALEKVHPVLVVIDSLSCAHGTSENSSGMRSVMTGLAKVARDSNAAILAVHHFRKEGESSGAAAALDRLRGSSSIAQLARVVWAIDRPDPNDSRRRLMQIKNNLAPVPAPLGFEVGDKGVSFGPPPKLTTQAEAAADFIRSLLAAGPLGAAKAIRQCKEVGFGETTIWKASRIVGVMKTRKTQTGAWLWSLPGSQAPQE